MLMLTPEKNPYDCSVCDNEDCSGCGGNAYERGYEDAVAKLLSSIPDDGKLREEIAQETRTLLFGYNVGPDYVEVVSGKFADQIIDLVKLRWLNKVKGMKVLKIDLESISHPTSTNMSGISISRKEWEEFWAEQLKENRYE